MRWGNQMTGSSLAPLQQIDAGMLNVGYAEVGPADGQAVLLLHGWPYDIHSYAEVASLLASRGYRVIVPFVRGFGTTRFLSSETPRNGQPGAVASDVVRHLKHLTEGLGADVVIDAVGAEADGNLLQHVTAAKLKLQGGSPVALNWAIDTVRKGGTVSVVGAYGPLFSAVKFGDAMNKGLTLRMNQCPVKRQWPRLFEHIRNGYFKPSDLVTHHVPLEHIAEGYHMFSAKLDNCIKPIVVPSAG